MLKQFFKSKNKLQTPSIGSNSQIVSQLHSLEIEKDILTKTIARLYQNETDLTKIQKDRLLLKYQHQLGVVITRIEKLENASKHPDLGPLGDGLITLMDQKLSQLDQRLYELTSKIQVAQTQNDVKITKNNKNANEIENKFSLRASVTAELFLDNVRVPNDNVLPGVKGLKGPLSCLTQARYGISWGVIGAAEACLEQLIEYTQTRVLFDRTLDENQAIQIRLADMQRRIVTSSLLSYRLGQLKDEGKMDPTQVSLAKWNNVRMALDVARDARDMLGGSGISAEYVPIRHMLNLESVITYEGTETIHQLTVGRGLTGKNAF